MLQTNKKRLTITAIQKKSSANSYFSSISEEMFSSCKTSVQFKLTQTEEILNLKAKFFHCMDIYPTIVMEASI